jgi:hypothetical protein
MQPVPVITKVVSLNHGEMYLIQHYVIKFVSDTIQEGRFFPNLVSFGPVVYRRWADKV